MLEPKKFKVEGLEFYTQPLPVMTAMKLDKRVLALILPALDGLKGMKMDDEVDFGSLFPAISDSLVKLPDGEFEDLVLRLLSQTAFLEKGQTPIEINDPKVLDKIFGGALITLYKVLFEIMRYNKFSPFALMGDGFGMSKIHTSVEQTKKESKTGTGSGLLDS